MTFSQLVYKQVSQIPVGQLATYGQIATMIGHPRSSRQVGFALRRLGLNEDNVPWWRVVNAKGYISINHGSGGIEKNIQRSLLEEEGVEISDDMTLDLEKYRWLG